MVEVVSYLASGERVLLSHVADVSEVSWSTGWGNNLPSGCQQASWKMNLRPDIQHPALAPGRRVEVWDGAARVFAGQLTEPDRSDGWHLTAIGLPVLGADYLCFGTVPNAEVNAAINRGLPWTRHESISAAALANADVTLDYIDALLTSYAATVNKRWAVWADGEVVLRPDPTTPDYILATEAVIGSNDAEFYTHLWGLYVDSVSGTPPEPSGWDTVQAGDAEAAVRSRRKEGRADFTNLGLMDAARAQSLVDAALAQVGPRMGYANGIQVTSDELLTVGGVPARLSQVRAGQMVRLTSVIDENGSYVTGQVRDIVIGETRYTDGSGMLDILPMGLVRRDVGSILAPQAPRELGGV